jgi:hypothetical protein
MLIAEGGTTRAAVRRTPEPVSGASADRRGSSFDDWSHLDRGADADYRDASGKSGSGVHVVDVDQVVAAQWISG